MNAFHKLPLPPRSLLPWLGLLLFACLALGGVYWQLLRQHPEYFDGTREHRRKLASRFPLEAMQCAECHRTQFEAWSASHHAAANHTLGKADLEAFKVGGTVRAGTESFSPLVDTSGLPAFLHRQGPQETVLHPVAALGVSPLIQYLVPAEGGRLQVVPVAYDATRFEWFNALENEARQGQWGHWTGRGLTWNVQCASCHMTGYRKAYESSTDHYASAWERQGLSCAACHTGLERHLRTPKDPAARPQPLGERAIDTCASCHARREELKPGFTPGARFTDHFRPSLPDEAGVYHPDGQIQQEDFEYGSFIQSRMHLKGVRCLDCHDPHSGKTRLPSLDNSLCLQCHGGAATRGAPTILQEKHQFHATGTPGGRCVDCHMPQTTYMGRHARRDHSFSSPDPLLTRELGIPNACNRCHQDRSIDWAIEKSEAWYGKSLERPSRERARLVDALRAEEPGLAPRLASALGTEEIPAWRASLLLLSAPYLRNPELRRQATRLLQDPDPLVRSAAVQVLAPLPSARSQLEPLRDDASRLVRLDASLGLPRTLGTDPSALAEVNAYLANLADQPAGALRLSEYEASRGHLDLALLHARHAAEWDPGFVSLSHLASLLEHRGRLVEAEASLRKASNLEPDNPEAQVALDAFLSRQRSQTNR